MNEINFPRGEVLGRGVVVMDSSDSLLMGLQGRIVGETQKTFLLDVSGREVIVQKSRTTFRFVRENIVCSGDLLLGRGVDRLKKRLPGKWEVDVA